MSVCDDKQDEFLKNEYILNLNELIVLKRIYWELLPESRTRYRRNQRNRRRHFD